MRVILSVLMFLLFTGCEKYEMVSEPFLTGGRWSFDSYRIEGINGIPESDTLCVSDLLIEKIINGSSITQNEFINTSKERRFIVGVTEWSFDNSSYSLSINDSSFLWVNYNDKRTIMTVDNNTSYPFYTDGNYAQTLTLKKSVWLPNLGKSVYVTIFFSRD